MFEITNRQARIISDMCDKTTCKYCPFKADDIRDECTMTDSNNVRPFQWGVDDPEKDEEVSYYRSWRSK